MWKAFTKMMHIQKKVCIVWTTQHLKFSFCYFPFRARPLWVSLFASLFCCFSFESEASKGKPNNFEQKTIFSWMLFSFIFFFKKKNINNNNMQMILWINLWNVLDHPSALISCFRWISNQRNGIQKLFFSFDLGNQNEIPSINLLSWHCNRVRHRPNSSFVCNAYDHFIKFKVSFLLI